MGKMMTKAEQGSQVKDLLAKYQLQIAQSLPRHITPERMMRVTCNSILRTPKLLECSQASLVGAVLESAALGLIPDGVLGHAYLVPYGQTATLIPGYKGLLQLARRSGEISTIYAEVVHEGDVFEVSLGTDPKIDHVPDLTAEKLGDVIAVYSVAKMKDGGFQFEVMSKAQVETVRKRSRAGKSGPWVTDWEEMAKKTTLRRLCKMLPCSTELERAVALDERAERGIPQQLDIVASTVVEEEEGEVIVAEPYPDEDPPKKESNVPFKPGDQIPQGDDNPFAGFNEEGK